MNAKPGAVENVECPHGHPLADNTCGPCSEGRPMLATEQHRHQGYYQSQQPKPVEEVKPHTISDDLLKRTINALLDLVYEMDHESRRYRAHRDLYEELIELRRPSHERSE